MGDTKQANQMEVSRSLKELENYNKIKKKP